MSNELSVFTNDKFGEVRTTTIDGEIWFVGKDVAKALGYAKPENAIAAHVDREDKTTTLIQGTGSNYKSKTTLINESGLYSLTFSSKLPDAKAFKHWVTHEVIPSIRKTGQYKVADGQQTTFKGKGSIVSQAKAFSTMIESMNNTMTLTNKQKLDLYHKFCDPLGFPVPDMVPSDGSCHTADKLLDVYGVAWDAKFMLEQMAKLKMVQPAYNQWSNAESYQLINDGLNYGVNMWDWENKVYIPFFYDKIFPKLISLVINIK